MPPELRGTYLGLCSDPMIEYFQSLGVTALELMPLAAFAGAHAVLREEVRHVDPGITAVGANLIRAVGGQRLRVLLLALRVLGERGAPVRPRRPLVRCRALRREPVAERRRRADERQPVAAFAQRNEKRARTAEPVEIPVGAYAGAGGGEMARSGWAAPSALSFSPRPTQRPAASALRGMASTTEGSIASTDADGGFESTNDISPAISPKKTVEGFVIGLGAGIETSEQQREVMMAEFNWAPNSLQMQLSLPGLMTELK